MDTEQNLVAEETAAEVVEETVENETPADEYAIADSLVREETPVVEPETKEVEEETEADVKIKEIVEEEPIVEENLTNDDNSEQSISTENQDSIEDTQSSQENFAKSDNKDEDDNEEDSESEEEDKEYECGKNKKKKSYSLLENELAEVKAAYSELESKYQALVEFKETVDNEKKDALIASFYMLSDEDKAEVVENKAKYSLEDIEAKLSVICVRKKVNFDLDDTSKNDNIVEEKEVMTYNISNNESTSIPAWISALKNTRDNRK